MSAIQEAVHMYVSKIREYKDAAELKGVQAAKIYGDKAYIQGVAYPVSMAADVNLRDGDIAFVSLDDTGTRAVVLG